LLFAYGLELSGQGDEPFETKECFNASSGEHAQMPAPFPWEQEFPFVPSVLHPEVIERLAPFDPVGALKNEELSDTVAGEVGGISGYFLA
jgi:hypothetical protein